MGTKNTKRLPLGVPLACALGVMAQAAAAQCGPPLWSHGHSSLGPDGVVRATVMWDADGIGPQPPRLVVGGAFATVGSQRVNNVAVWDPFTGSWSALADGVDGTVTSLAVRPNGELIVAGSFLTAGGATVNHIARWTGSAWSDLAGGVLSGGAPEPIRALATMPNGDLLVGGPFVSTGTCCTGFFPGLVRWNGSAWSVFGNSTTTGGSIGFTGTSSLACGPTAASSPLGA